MSSKPRVLVIDDETEMRKMLELGLSQHGFEVRCASDGSAALTLLKDDWRPDAIVLDVMMPKVDGMTLIPMVRRLTEAPILMLSALKEVPDKIAALTAGADDYLGKPFDLGELAARLHSRVRRPQLLKPQIVSFGGIVMNLERRTVMRDDQPVDLTTREFDLLATLLREPGRVFTREQLIDKVWGADAEVEPNVVETYVSYLRSKLDAPAAPSLIQTVRRVGYTIR
ncbi:MAG: response regulator transcription factor [Candidatus Eremiobacteraeota bacterium]|nr:response regulator transcription factor [Candidatus Eremiobacteraeota bacterium]MBV8331461.1 response regulator transcription factor [Candidatus Eremiobacteraeota bacterium]MBV8721880.1 response regulator transcription factor [Candidatus Eremiobacteraeota bacterium]